MRQRQTDRPLSILTNRFQEVLELAKADRRNITRHVFRARCRKSVPEWSAPAEAWRQLLVPSAKWHPRANFELERLLAVHYALSVRLVDASLTIYADDTQKLHLLRRSTAAEVAETLRCSDLRYDAALGEFEMQQHRSKQEARVKLNGLGSLQEVNHLFKGEVPINGRIAFDARSVGCRLHGNFSNSSEISARLKAIDEGFHSMGKLWCSDYPDRQLRIPSRMFVASTGSSGLTAYVLTERENENRHTHL